MDYSDAMLVLTPAQFNQLVEIMQAQAELSLSTGCKQTIEIVFKSGHIRWINASNNAQATTHGMVMDEGYQWRKAEPDVSACPDCGSPYPSGKYEAHFTGCPREGGQ